MSDTYRLSYARKKELYERRKQFGLLADWYGEDFAKTEIAAHTNPVHNLNDDIQSLMDEVVSRESNVYMDISANWKSIGGAIANLTTPGGLKNNVLFLEVRHSALLRELQHVSEIIIPKLNERYGDNTITEIRLINASKKQR